MLQSVFQKALRLVVLVLLLFNIAVSGAFAQAGQSQDVINPQPSETARPREAQPSRIEPAQNQERRTPERNRARQRADSTRRSDGTRPQDPYEDYYDAMKKFNQEVYGKRG